MEDLVKGLNESNTAKLIKESGLLEEANVGLELSITPKKESQVQSSISGVPGLI